MKAWKRIFACAVLAALLIFFGVNLALVRANVPQSGRPYRVEINRLALVIEEKGIQGADLSECEYVYNIAEYGENFYGAENDYIIKEIDGRLYRFDYSAKKGTDNMPVTVIVNIALGVMTAAVFAFLIYVGEKILRPFERLTNVPYELSKGNLTVPVKESKSRFFGKFLWGIDLLRENIEEQKQRELELQREKKTLLLSLSHDIKTPLSAIKLYSKALSKNLYPDEKKRREIAESINAKAEKIEGILAYYREKAALVKTRFVVGEYENCLIYGDLNRSVEVLQNLIENALKYGDGRAVELMFPEEDGGVLAGVGNGGGLWTGRSCRIFLRAFGGGRIRRGFRAAGWGFIFAGSLWGR